MIATCAHDPNRLVPRLLNDGPDDPLKYCFFCDAVVQTREDGPLLIVGGIKRKVERYAAD